MIWRVFFALQGLVLVHELGHLLVARLVRMPVEVVSLGMGPRLFGYRTLETDYRVSLLPVGGYVRVGAWSQEATSDTHALRRLTGLWRELLVLGAGPLASLTVPILLFLVAHAGATDLPAAEVGDVEPGLPAAGILAPGDIVLRVEGESVESYWDLERILAAPHTGVLAMDVLRDGRELPLRLPAYTGKVGVLPHASRPVIAVLGSESPAYRAGLRSADEIVAIGGRRIGRWSEVVTALVRSRGDAVQIAFLRPVPSESDPVFVTYEAHVAVLSSRVMTQALNRDYLFQPLELAQRTGIVRGDLLVERVSESGQAWAIGIRPGDILRSVCGVEVGTPAGFRRRLEALTDSCVLVVWRGDHTESFPLAKDLLVQGFGLDLRETRVASTRVRHVPSAVYVMSRAWRDALQSGHSSARAIIALLTGGSRDEKDLPLFKRIADSVRALGGTGEPGGQLRLYANLSAQLGLVNLLPLPMLDGGTILWSLWIRRKASRPGVGSERAKARWDRMGWLIFAVAFVLFALRG